MSRYDRALGRIKHQTLERRTRPGWRAVFNRAEPYMNLVCFLQNVTSGVALSVANQIESHRPLGFHTEAVCSRHAELVKDWTVGEEAPIGSNVPKWGTIITVHVTPHVSVAMVGLRLDTGILDLDAGKGMYLSARNPYTDTEFQKWRDVNIFEAAFESDVSILELRENT